MRWEFSSSAASGDGLRIGRRRQPGVGIVGAIQFWLVEGAEVANAFTHGGNYAASFPASIFAMPMRVLFTFVVPAAFVAYLPTLVLLDLPGPPGLPQWLGWCTPLAAAAIWGIALTAWRAGVRHYTGAGS